MSRPGVLGVVIGAGAVGGMLASLTAKRLGNRLGIGLVYVVGCFVFTAAAGAGAAGRQRARGGGAADAVRGRVRERVRRDGARHPHRRDLRDGHPRHDAVAGVGRVPGDQLRHPAGRGAARRGCSAPRPGSGPRCGSRWPAGRRARCCCCRRRCPDSGCRPGCPRTTRASSRTPNPSEPGCRSVAALWPTGPPRAGLWPPGPERKWPCGPQGPNEDGPGATRVGPVGGG